MPPSTSKNNKEKKYQSSEDLGEDVTKNPYVIADEKNLLETYDPYQLKTRSDFNALEKRYENIITEREETEM
jgi:hypothetical protein